jgi:hypothetical protein
LPKKKLSGVSQLFTLEYNNPSDIWSGVVDGVFRILVAAYCDVTGEDDQVAGGRLAQSSKADCVASAGNISPFTPIHPGTFFN